MVPEVVQDLELLAPADVFVEGRGHGFLLGGVVADPPGFVDQVVVDGKIGRHGYTLSMCRISHIADV